MSEATPAGIGTRWRRRRTLAWGIRTLCIVVPMVASVAAMAVAGHTIPRLSGAAKPLWYVALFAISFVVLLLARRTVRRLLPLATLLDMTLEFPALAPSRLDMSRRAHSARELSSLMERAKDETTQEAAERVLTLLAAFAKHDRATRGHAERVRAYTDLLASRMGLSSRERDRLRWASLLHDIGKLHVPVSILTKPSKPSEEEWEILRRHPVEGGRIAAALIPWLGEFGQVIEQHHERFDGKGYPYGLEGHRICRGARIVSVADTFEVMTAPRPYKRPIKREAALAELVACSGTQFDPEVVRAFLAVDSKRMLWAMGPSSWLAGLPLIGQAPAPLIAAIGNQTMNLTTAAVVGAVSAASVAVAAPATASASASASTNVSHETSSRGRSAFVAGAGQPNRPTHTNHPSATRSIGGSGGKGGSLVDGPSTGSERLHTFDSTSTGTMLPAKSAVAAQPQRTGQSRGGTPTRIAPPGQPSATPTQTTPAQRVDATPASSPGAPKAKTKEISPLPTPASAPAPRAPKPPPAPKPAPAPKPGPAPKPAPAPKPGPTSPAAPAAKPGPTSPAAGSGDPAPSPAFGKANGIANANANGIANAHAKGN